MAIFYLPSLALQTRLLRDCSEESLTKAEVNFFNWACVPTTEVCFCVSTPDFTIVSEDWGNHTVEDFWSYSWGVKVLMLVYLLMPKKECMAVSRRCSCVILKFPVGDNLTPRYVYSWVDSIGWPFRKNMTFDGFRAFFWKIIVLVFFRFTVIFQSSQKDWSLFRQFCSPCWERDKRMRSLAYRSEFSLTPLGSMSGSEWLVLSSNKGRSFR